MNPAYSRQESCSLRHVNESQTSWPHNRTDNERSYYQNIEQMCYQSLEM